MALRNYRDEYGELPAGAGLDIIKALRGNNPRRIVFIDFRDKQFDAAGRLLDPWGSPYRIDVSDPDHPRVYSPGKNKRAEPGVAPSDDVCSWR